MSRLTIGLLFFLGSFHLACAAELPRLMSLPETSVYANDKERWAGDHRLQQQPNHSVAHTGQAADLRISEVDGKQPNTN